MEAEGDAGGLCEGRELSPGVGFGRQGLQEITRKPLEVINMFIILTVAVVSQKHICI